MSVFGVFYAIVRQIPAGKVAPMADRSPCWDAPLCQDRGYAMAGCQDATVPCHRVVDRFGGTKACFDTHSPGTQRALLEAEGVLFRLDGTVDLERCQWEPSVSVL